MIGLSTYAYLWRWSRHSPEPLSLHDMLHDAASLGAHVFQICDYPPLEGMSDNELARTRKLAADLGVVLEVGTRGTHPEHLNRYLHIAEALDSTFVRSMIKPGDGPDLEEIPQVLAGVLPAYAERGVALGLETYEQVPTSTLVGIVDAVAHPALGIVLDPGNCVAALEHPAEVVDRTSPYVKNLHVKDFAFSRRDGWVGFTFAGAPLGEGLLDYDDMVRRVQPAERGINQVIEHWLPWTDDFPQTARLEDEWTRHNIEYLRSKNP
ncbi:sugar phosphate isomerase/epimerase family protein [Phytoactinopolyspora endophytica]|uniref:sugar phosphate isomerase/epimerase family protein n=1 Tax=Phytoactinopolyspora endophytica TaxID=1642495 RepID=UPI00101DE8BC|nr:TIM barrel protein [Phytoactinopolyspora endophytica]